MGETLTMWSDWNTKNKSYVFIQKLLALRVDWL